MTSVTNIYNNNIKVVTDVISHIYNFGKIQIGHKTLRLCSILILFQKLSARNYKKNKEKKKSKSKINTQFKENPSLLSLTSSSQHFGLHSNPLVSEVFT